MITSEDILKYSEWIKNGAEIENPKLELKQQWWDLGDDLSQNEFLKDVTAMANTPGNTGYIIIGIDKKGELHDALIPIDSSKIRGIICKHIQDPMNIEVYQIPVGEKSISVIEIPESFNKPHVIKVYRTSKQTINMYIPIRKGTSVNATNKYDLDIMYLERNRKVIIDYGLDIVSGSAINIVVNEGSDIYFDYEIGIPAVVVNKGICINCIQASKFVIESGNDIGIDHEYEIKFIMINNEKQYFGKNSFPKICPNDFIQGFFNFGLSSDDRKKLFMDKSKFKYHLEATDIMGNKFLSNTFFLG